MENLYESDKIESKLDRLQSGKWQHKLPLLLLLLFSVIIQVSLSFMGIDNSNVDVKYNENPTLSHFYWNENQQAGVPQYSEYVETSNWFVNFVQTSWRKILNCRILLSFLGALGIYLFLCFIGIRPLAALLGGIGYLLAPGWLSLAKMGNIAEFRFIAYLPGILFSMKYLRLRLSLLASGILSLFIGLAFNENLPDYTIYLLFLVTIFFIYGLFNFIIEKKWKDLSLFIILFITAVVTAAGWNIWFYKINFHLSNLTIGNLFVNFKGSYLQSGSLPVKETFSLIIPGLLGNTGATYWGSQPYNLSYNYLGTATFFLAIWGVIKSKRNISILLGIYLIFFIIFSWGRNLIGWQFIPVFSKIHTPAVALHFIPVFVAILAALGVETLLNLAGGKSALIIKIMVGFGLMMLIFIAVSVLLPDSFFTAGVSQVSDKLLGMRSQIFLIGGIQFFVVVIFLLGAFLIHSKAPKASNTVILAVIILLMLDQGFTLFTALPKSRIKTETQLIPKQMEEFLQNDDDQFRILPLGGEFGNPRWSKKFQTIDGFNAVNLERYTSILDHCLTSEISNRLALNWNIVNMLNVKYLIYDKKIPAENLKYSLYDLDEELTLYENQTVMPRYWFAADYEIVKDKIEIIRRLNNPDFDPRNLAILEDNQGELVKGLTSARETFRNSNRIEYTTICDTTALLVQSEVYCKVGWKAFLDGKEIDIFPVNYILRGVMVPGGEHKLEFRYEIEKIKFHNLFKWLGIGWLVLALTAGLFMYVRRNYSGGINYSVKK